MTAVVEVSVLLAGRYPSGSAAHFPKWIQQKQPCEPLRWCGWAAETGALGPEVQAATRTSIRLSRGALSPHHDHRPLSLC